jgi:hypothetical protein
MTSRSDQGEHGNRIELRAGRPPAHRDGDRLAIISLGIGALMAFSKSKKHYIGLVWDARRS